MTSLIRDVVKGHVRKGGSLEAMKEFTRASDAYQKALNIDPNNVEALEGHRRCLSVSFQAISFVAMTSSNFLEYMAKS